MSAITDLREAFRELVGDTVDEYSDSSVIEVAFMFALINPELQPFVEAAIKEEQETE